MGMMTKAAQNKVNIKEGTSISPPKSKSLHQAPFMQIKEVFQPIGKLRKQLIKMLAAALGNQHIEIKQRKDDADVVTVQTALKKTQKGYPGC